MDRVGDQREKRWKRQVECRYYVELEGAEPERGMKLLPRETADPPSLPVQIPRLPSPRWRRRGWVGFARSFTAAPRATRIGRLVSEAVLAKISSILRIESNRFAKILKIRILESKDRQMDRLTHHRAEGCACSNLDEPRSRYSPRGGRSKQAMRSDRCCWGWCRHR